MLKNKELGVLIDSFEKKNLKKVVKNIANKI